MHENLDSKEKFMVKTKCL